MSHPAGAPEPHEGPIAPLVRAEFPDLRLRWLLAPARAGPSPSPLRARLARLSDRYRGAGVVAMRTQSIARAYRSFFRQVGLDPDVNRIPSERVAVQRLLDGGFLSRDWLTDALLVALVETGVPVWALSAERVDAQGPGIRTSRPGDRLGLPPHDRLLVGGRLVVASAERVHAVLFDDVHAGDRVTPATRRAALYAVAVPDVSELAVTEALWACSQCLAPGDNRW